MTNKPILSIIFLTWNGKNETEKSLESIRRNTTIPFEIIFVDNGSIDGTKELIKEYSKKIFINKYCVASKVIYNEENLGVSKGYNKGLKEINPITKYITICSNDWLLPYNWNNRMIDCLESEPMCGLATACSNYSATSFIDSNVNPNPLKKPEIKWNDPELFEKLESIDEYLLNNNTINIYTSNQFVCIGWTMKKEVFDDIGFMDERIRLTNDVSYAYRAMKKGWISKTAWNIYVHHFLQVSSSQIPKEEQILRESNDWNIMLSNEAYKE